jgi:hypothetical protein
MAQMTQISFQPALDPFHATFRLLRLWPLLNQHGPLHFNTVRILDFVLLFPFYIRGIRLATKHQKHKKLSEKYPQLRPYGQLPDPRVLFERMEPMQTAAIQTVMSHGMLDEKAWKQGEVSPIGNEVPQSITRRVAELNEQQLELMGFLKVLATEYELTGDSGLKARTGLLDHRYDAI